MSMTDYPTGQIAQGGSVPADLLGISVGGGHSGRIDPASYVERSEGAWKEFYENFPELAWLLEIPEFAAVITTFLAEIETGGAGAGYPKEEKNALLKRLLVKAGFFEKYSASNQKYREDALDPANFATFRQNLRDRYDDVIRAAMVKGVVITDTEASGLAHQSYRYGWTGDEMAPEGMIGHALLNIAKMRAHQDDPVFASVGDVGQWVDYGNKRARNQLVDVDPDVLYNYALMASDGYKTKADMDRWIDGIAKGSWGTYSENIETWFKDTGGSYTISDYLAGAKKSIAETLEIEERDISWFDPKYAQVVYHKDADGNHKFMDKYEAKEWAQSRGKGWEDTGNYRERMAHSGSVIQKAMMGRSLF